MRFLGDVEGFLATRADLERLLTEVTVQDLRDVATLRRELPAFLGRLPDAESRSRVLAVWEDALLDDEEFALAILESLGSAVGRNPDLSARLVDVLLPVALDDGYSSRGRRLRDTLEQLLGDRVRDAQSFQLARKLDAEHDRRSAREAKRRAEEEEAAEHAAAEKRRLTADRIGQLASMPVLDRLQIVAAGAAGIEKPLPGDWANLSDDELRRIPEDLRIALQRTLARVRRGPWRRLRSRLHALAGESRAKDRAKFNAALLALPAVDRLRALAESCEPVGYFDASFATWGIEHVSTIPSELRRQLLSRLAGQRRGIWRNFRRAILAEERATGGAGR